MTTIGGVGHTLPYLIPDFWTATILAVDRGRIGTRRHFLYPLSLHGHAVPVGGVPGGARRHAGVPRRHPDRQFVDLDGMIIRAGASVGSASCAAAAAAACRARSASARPATSTGGASAKRSTAPRCSRASSPTSRRSTPDHIAVTGDLVNLSLPAEYAPARAWLDALGSPARRHLRAGQSRRLCAQRRRRIAQRTGATIMRGDAARAVATRFPVPAAARAAGADRRVERGADAAVHGDRPPRRRAAAAPADDARRLRAARGCSASC